MNNNLFVVSYRGHPKKTWWDCIKDDVERLLVSKVDA